MREIPAIATVLLTVTATYICNAQHKDTAKIHQLNPVTVEAKRAVPERLQEIEGVSIFSGKKSEVLKLSTIDANLVANNARQLFGRVPGVSIWENDGSGVQVSIGARGLSPNRSWEFNVRQNGYDISSDVFGYPEAYYNPPMEAVEKIQFVRGGAALQFGAQFGGVLNYQLKHETANKPFCFQTQNSIGNNGAVSSYNTVGGNLGKWSYNAYVHDRKGNGWRENGGFWVRNNHVFLQHKFNEKTKVSAEYTKMDYEVQQSGGLTDAQFAIDHRQSFRSRNWFAAPWNIAAINLDHVFSQRFSMNIKVFGLLGERNSIGFLSAPTVKDSVNATLSDYNARQVDRDFYKNVGTEIRCLYTYRIFKTQQHLAFGARVYQANTDRKQRGKGTTGFDYHTGIVADKYPTELTYTTNNLAFFAENQWKLTDRFSVTPGIRVEKIRSSMEGRLTVSTFGDRMATPATSERNLVLGGLGLEYKYKTTDVYANVSQAFRPVLFSDLTPPSTTDVIDKDLKDANGFTADIGYRGTYGQFFSFDLSAFHILYNNKIGTVRRFLEDDMSKETYQYRTNLGKAAHTGVEAYFDISLSKTFKLNDRYGNLDLFASLAFIDAAYRDFKTTAAVGSAPNISIREENLQGKKVENAPRQIHNLGLTFAKKGFSATLQARSSGSVYTDASNTEKPNATGTIGKIDGYQVFDFSSEYKFLQHYNMKFSLNNLSNVKYATRRATGYPGPGLIPGEGRTFQLGIGIKL